VKNKGFVWPSVFVAVFFTQTCLLVHNPRDGAPLIGDSAEVHNIAWNLAHGRGYSVNWDDREWRAAYLAHSKPSIFLDMILSRSGSHPTMSRPPLMPLLVAAVIRIYPKHAFLAWRLVDAALFSLGACLLASAIRAVFGDIAAVIVLAIMLLDPLRFNYVPGWWTEGIAFDGMAAIVWLLVRGRATMGLWSIVMSGIVLGLICLDRSFFILLLPIFACLLGNAAVAPTASIRFRLRSAGVVLFIAMLVQVPWWLRNIAIAHEMMPLGTQGGFNLPDEYSDHAVATHGAWDGDGMGWAWSTRAGATPAEVAGHFSAVVAGMRPAHPRSGDAIYATMCGTLSSEIAVAKVGSHSGIRWIASHPRRLPALFLMKIVTQIKYNGWWMLCLAVAGAAGLLLMRQRPVQLALLILIGSYLVGIGLTHTMPERFLVPMLPPLYALAAAGLAGLAWRIIAPARGILVYAR
jgi:4-amino-4-deoxy-L-arabinose transferase-like glycosyltransferase